MLAWLALWKAEMENVEAVVRRVGTTETPLSVPLCPQLEPSPRRINLRSVSRVGVQGPASGGIQPEGGRLRLQNEGEGESKGGLMGRRLLTANGR